MTFATVAKVMCWMPALFNWPFTEWGIWNSWLFMAVDTLGLYRSAVHILTFMTFPIVANVTRHRWLKATQIAPPNPNTVFSHFDS